MSKTSWLVALSIVGFAFGCGGEEETISPTGDEHVQPGPAGNPEPEAPAGPVVNDPTYELRAEATPPYTAGEQGTFQIRLTPRGHYHVNQEFPMSIALTAPGGVTVPGAALGNGDAQEFSEQVARFEVPFTASAAGEHRVTALVDFAVCTPEACMPDQRTLALVLPVQ